MASIEFALSIPANSKKKIEYIHDKVMHVTAVNISRDSKHVMITDVSQGEIKMFIPWKQPLSMLKKLVGQDIDFTKEVVIQLINVSNQRTDLIIQIIGEWK